MSAPSRGRGGGGGIPARATSSSRGRVGHRGHASSTQRGRGRGRGSGATSSSTNSNPGGLLQKLRTGTVHRNSEDGISTGQKDQGFSSRGRPGASVRGRGNISKTFNTSASSQNDNSAPTLRNASPAPGTLARDFRAQITEKYHALKPQREAERKKAIRDGVLADPDKKTSLANAITPVGTCTEMCPAFERVERTVQNMVDKCERVLDEATGRDMPSEERMVKRFKRAAAGDSEQLPSDIRTPQTLRRSLDYLLDRIVGGGERLASIHKFVWDRTRAIRNDFSIQQVSKKEDVSIAIDCYERIARFHILSLHQLSNPDNLNDDEEFEAHQEREQLNNTLLSLMYYYDDNRGKIPLPHEPEFRAYCILFELQSRHPDLEDRMQAWPKEILTNPKIQTALKLHAAVGNTVIAQGPLTPLTPFSIAQSDTTKFWTLLSSQAVSYLMACVAEVSFGMIRFIALDALWRSGKSAPQSQQARNQDWTTSELQNYLAFDDEQQTLEFCQSFDLAFKIGDHGEECMDFTAMKASNLDKSLIPASQVFSHDIVEAKRYRRSLVAVINGLGIATAIRQGMVSAFALHEDNERLMDTDEQSMFIPENAGEIASKPAITFGSQLNPGAASFTPSSIFGTFGTPDTSKPEISTIFGKSFITNTSVSTQAPGFDVNSASTFTEPAKGIAQVEESVPKQPTSRNVFGSGMFSPNIQDTAQKQNSPSPFSVFKKADSAQPSFSFSQPTKAMAVSNAFNFSQTQQAPGFVPTIASADSGKAPEDKSDLHVVDLPQQKSPEQKTSTAPTPTSAPTPDNNTFGKSTLQEQSEVQTAPPIFSFKDASQKSATESLAVSGVATSTAIRSTPAGSNAVAKSNSIQLFQPVHDFSNKANAIHLGTPTSNQPAPLFKFSAPEIASQSASRPPQPPQAQQPSQVSSPHLLEPSTTPQGTPKRPSFSDFKFPSTKEHHSASSVTQSTAPTSNTLEPSSDPSMSRASSTEKSAPHPSKPAPEPCFTAEDRDKLIENTSRAILTQPQGLIEYFVSHHVSNVLQKLVKQYLQQQHQEIISRVRINHLARKFFAIWRTNVQQSILMRRAKQRRKLLGAAMRAEQAKRRRDEVELEAILAAAEESKRMQEEQRKASRVVKVTNLAEAALRSNGPTQARPVQVIGHKRKSPAPNDQTTSTSEAAQNSRAIHKRSRTVDMTGVTNMAKSLPSRTTNQLSSTSFGNSSFGQSLFSRSSSQTDLRKSMSQKVDSTKTDYFKLKAMGIDPQTPLIPDTAKTLAQNRRKAQEERQVMLGRSMTRPSIFSSSVSSRPSSPATQPMSKASPAKTHISASKSDSNVVALKSPITPLEDDVYLKQLREARQSMAKDADWFKNQTAVLEKEIQQQEELCRSYNSRPNSQHSDPHVSSNGLASVNGFEYYPMSSKPGRTLSRTEERIRRTGGHGLATRPVGSDYVAVAMSRKSAVRYSIGSSNESVSAGTKRSSRLSNNSHDLEGPHRDRIGAALQTTATKRLKADSAVAKIKAKATGATSSFNSFAALQDQESEEQEEEDEDEADNEADIDHAYTNGADGDTEDNEDDLLEDPEDDEYEDDEEDSQDEADSAHNFALFGNSPDEERVYDDDDEEEEDGEDEDDATPGSYPQFSRAQSRSSVGVASGPGASVDDALVLSD